MNKKYRNYVMFLEDISVAMARIAGYVDGVSFAGFESDNKTKDFVIRNFEVIGEAAKNLPVEIREKYPDVPWVEMYLLRNKVSHEYFGIDNEIIWDIAIHHLPVNMRRIDEIIRIEKEKC